MIAIARIQLVSTINPHDTVKGFKTKGKFKNLKNQQKKLVAGCPQPEGKKFLERPLDPLEAHS